MNRALALAAAAMVAVVGSASCSDDDDAPTPPTTSTSSTTTAPGTTTAAPPLTTTAAPPSVRATTVATMSEPLGFAPVGTSGTTLIAEKRGRVVTLADRTIVLDISDEVSTGGEQGLLGIAVHPTGEFVYLNYTDRGGDSHVVEYALASPSEVDRSSRRELLSVPQPFSNHNGGHLAFGPGGYLYVGFGDGGGQGDHNGNAQNPDSRLGKILRVDPRAERPSPEVFALGLRNPWRFSFDRVTDDLWIGDVGGSDLEEVDRVARGVVGANFGWDLMEGSQRTGSAGPPTGHIGPVYEYPTSDGCAITGGFVYRGAGIPGLSGFYLFADHCAGEVLALRSDEAGARPHSLGITVERLASFGEDPAGELYVLSLDGHVVQLVAG